jgi:hypothetical protein
MRNFRIWISAIFWLSMVIYSTAPAGAQTVGQASTAKVPASVSKAIEHFGGIVLDCRLANCFLKGDFDGVGKTDYAVLVKQQNTKAKGILLVFASGGTALLGAGKPVQYGAEPSTDLNFDEWSVYSKDKVIESGEDQPVLKLCRDSLLVSYHESASGLFYWLRGKAHWYQQGD